jgi:hypothetical protein
MQAYTTAFTRLHYALAEQLFHCQPGVGTGGGEDVVALEERAKAGDDLLRRCVAGNQSGHDGWFPSARRGSTWMRLASRSGFSLVVSGRRAGCGCAPAPGRGVGGGHLDRGFAGAFGPSLPRSWVTCVLTVSSVTTRSWAMRWFDLPVAAGPAVLRRQAGAR